MKGIIASCFLFLAAPVLAELPASATEIFCSDQVVVVARVNEGTSEDCRLRMAAPCSEEDGMRLWATVSEVLAVKSNWDKVRFSTYDPALAPRHVGELVGRTLQLHVDAISGPGFGATDHEPDGPYLHNPTSAALTDADIGRLYAGKRYIFALEPLNSPGDPYWSGAWSLKSKNWAINTMRRAAGNDCPALLENQGRSFHGMPAADSPYRQALVSKVEEQLARWAESSLGVPVDDSLAAAREINPGIDAATWNTIRPEVDSAAVSMVTQRGSAFDLGLRAAFDHLSDSELSRLGADRQAAVEFARALDSAGVDVGNANVILDDAIKSVLRKHDLKVTP